MVEDTVYVRYQVSELSCWIGASLTDRYQLNIHTAIIHTSYGEVTVTNPNPANWCSQVTPETESESVGGAEIEPCPCILEQEVRLHPCPCVVGVAQWITPLPARELPHVGDQGLNPGLGDGAVLQPWARLLTLHWPTCNTIILVSCSG